MRRQIILPAAAFVASCAAAFVASCAAHVDSNMSVNGAPYSPATCISGQARGFPGVELVDENGARLRLATNVDGSASAAYFPAGSRFGENLGSCAAVRFEPGVGVVNGVRNVDGVGSFFCNAGQRHIHGSVRFENCH